MLLYFGGSGIVLDISDIGSQWRPGETEGPIMNLLIEQMRVPHTTRDRERMMRREDLLATARRTRCRERGCHPLAELVSRMLVIAGMRLNAWAAPSHRQVRFEPSRESLPSRAA